MGRIDTVTVDINITIPEESLFKCANIINMADKPCCSGEVVTVIDEGRCLGYYIVDEAHSSEHKISLIRVADFPYKQKESEG